MMKCAAMAMDWSCRALSVNSPLPAAVRLLQVDMQLVKAEGRLLGMCSPSNMSNGGGLVHQASKSITQAACVGGKCNTEMADVTALPSPLVSVSTKLTELMLQENVLFKSPRCLRSQAGRLMDWFRLFCLLPVQLLGPRQKLLAKASAADGIRGSCIQLSTGALW